MDRRKYVDHGVKWEYRGFQGRRDKAGVEKTKNNYC